MIQQGRHCHRAGRSFFYDHGFSSVSTIICPHLEIGVKFRIDEYFCRGGFDLSIR